MAVVLMHEKRASQTWNNLPRVGGSRWGFIGVIAGVAVVVILSIIIAICCCCKKSKKNKRMKYASQGSDLSALHPEPSFGRGASGAHRTKLGNARTTGYVEEDAFMASSPRHSFAGDYPHAGPVSSYGPASSVDPSAQRTGRTEHEMRNAYYDVSSQPSPSYAAYQYGPHHSTSADPYMSAVAVHDNGQFIEPQYVSDAHPYYPDRTNISATFNPHAGYSATPPPTHPQSPYAAHSPYHTPQASHYPVAQSPALASTYPQSYAAPSTTYEPPPYITYDSPLRTGDTSYDNTIVTPPPSKHRDAGGADV